MAISLHAHHYRYPEFFRIHEQGLLAVYIVALAIVIIAILVAGISLMQESRPLLTPP
jgi:hypothetical protein